MGGRWLRETALLKLSNEDSRSLSAVCPGAASISYVPDELAKAICTTGHNRKVMRPVLGAPVPAPPNTRLHRTRSARR